MSTIPIAELMSPSLRALATYWASKRNGRKMPARADLDPVEIPTLLPFMALIDVLDGEPRFRFRLIGTNIVQATGRDMTGKYVDATAYGDYLGELLRVYTSSIEIGGPTCSYDRAVALERGGIVLEWINLPLSGDSQTVNMLLMGADDVTFSKALATPEQRRDSVIAGQIYPLQVD